MLKDCNEAQFDSLITDLDALVATFDQVNLNYEKAEATTDEASKTTTLGSKLDVEITEELFNKIKEQTTAIRVGITE